MVNKSDKKKSASDINVIEICYLFYANEKFLLEFFLFFLVDIVGEFLSIKFNVSVIWTFF